MPREPQHGLRLSPRTLGRTGAAVPPVIWEVAPGGSAPDARVLDGCAAAGAQWIIIPAEWARPMPADWVVVLSVPAGLIQPRGSQVVAGALSRLGRQRCAAVLLRDLDANDAKAGWPFHRLSQLRGRGMIDYAFIESTDVATAEWMVEHSPAHALVLPFSPAEQSAKYRVLPAAAELGTALLARPPAPATVEDVSFVAGEGQIAALVHPLPTSTDEVTRIVEAVRNPLDAASRQGLWEAYQRRFPEPPRPRAGHPPELGA